MMHAGPEMHQSLREIALFVAAYEERSFTAAAARENATQSGVSQHIKKIEDRFGTSLFSRGTGSIVPTPAAEVYYRYCLDVLRASEAAARALQRHGGGLQGEFVVGLMPTMTRCALVPTLARFTQAHPNVSVRVVEAFSGLLTHQVASCEIAFAVVPAVTGTVGLKSRLLARTPEVLVSGPAAGLTHREPRRLRDLGALKLVVPGAQNARRSALDSYMASNDVRVERTLELDAMMGTLDMVARSDWVAVLPSVMMAAELLDGRGSPFVITPIVDPPLTLDLAIVERARHALPAPAAAFLEMLEADTRALNDQLKAALTAAGA